MNALLNRLQELNLQLPPAAPAVANYVPAVIAGNIMVISGQLPLRDGKLVAEGLIGRDVTLEQGQECARASILNVLAQANAAVNGDWSRIKRCMRLGGFIACVPEFVTHHLVMNGASDLIVEVMGEAGRHIRTTIGVPCLPLNAAVEVEAMFELN